MVFSSYLFLFYFLPLALALYYAAPHHLRLLVLALSSYAFYGWANPAFCVIMFFTTLVDYACGAIIASQFGPLAEGASPPPGPRTRTQRVALIVSIAANLGLLGFFKYFGFGIENYNALMHAAGLDTLRWDTAFRVALPLGISFYTFKSISYTVDIYRGEARPLRDFTAFACYIAMFPQLVAGPIVRFREISVQFEDRKYHIENFARGVALFSLGLAKKVLIANVLARAADACFGAGSLAMLDAWYGLVSYSLQIYFDFSGYSDMAIGLGLMLGFVLPRNFDAPYRAASISEFWRRWHQSFSHFLRDYLYIPLGGNRHSVVRTCANLGVVMLLGGLWHGASWGFVAWGAYHGALLIGERIALLQPLRLRAPRRMRVFAVFVLVSLGWVLFRAPDLSAARDYYLALFRMGVIAPQRYLIGGLIYQPYYLLTLAVALPLTWAAPQSIEFTRRLDAPRAALIFGVFLVSVAVMLTQAYSPFVFFTL